MRYEYYCKTCGHTYQLDRKIVDRDNEVDMNCSECEDGIIARSVGCAGFVLKGGGWADSGYATTIGDELKFKGEPTE